MLKTLLVGLWVCAATLGAAYATATVRGGDNEAAAEPTYFAGLDWRRTDPVTVPILSKNAVEGYVLARFVYTIDGEAAAGLAVPPDAFILNDVFASVYQTSDFDFSQPQKYDLEALKAGIKTSVNKRYGTELIREILVEQFDFLPKEKMAPDPQSASNG